MTTIALTTAERRSLRLAKITGLIGGAALLAVASADLVSAESAVEFLVNRGARATAPAPRPAPLPAFVPTWPQVPEPTRRASRPSPDRPLTRRPAREGDSLRTASDNPGARTICVRMCDGYHFPATAGGDDRLVEASCRAACPGATVKAFDVPASGDVGEARSGRLTYRKLPVAFAFEKARDASCSCARPELDAFAAYRDPTLRSGDIVIFPDTAKVFRGRRGLTHKPSDFADYRQAREISGRERALIAAALGQGPAVRDPTRAASRRLKREPEPAATNVSVRLGDEARRADGGPRVIVPAMFGERR
jgi:hypothetical protein